MGDITTRVEVPNENTEFYSRDLLINAKPRLLHTQFAQVRDIPAGSGTNIIKFRKYGVLEAQTTPLVAGVTPKGKKLSSTSLTATVLYYGDFITLTDEVLITTKDPLLTETAELLGDQVGLSLDTIFRDILNAGTNVQYPDIATARTEITSGMIMTGDEIDFATTTLEMANADYMTSRVDPSTGYNTIPLKPCYVGIVHTYVANDIQKIVGFIPAEKYADKRDLMDYEFGSYNNVRFLKTPRAKVFTAGGADGQNVYSTLIMAKHACGITRLSNLTLQNIVTPLGSAGGADPLKQRATSGWKLSFTGLILQQGFMVRIETSASNH